MMKSIIALYAIPVAERKMLEERMGDLARIIHKDAPISTSNLDTNTEILVVLPSSTIDASIVGRLPKLRAIVSLSAGLDHIKVDGSTNVQVINNPTFSITPVSEYVLSCIFHSYYKNYWQNPTAQHEEIFGKKVLVVGYGSIGKSAANKLCALGAKVQVFTSAPIDKNAEMNGVTKCHDLLVGIAQADIISLNTSLRAGTALLFGSKAFACIKPGAIFINAARGGLVDNAALLEALDESNFSNVYLDDIADIEAPEAQAIVRHDKVIYTYHTAWLTKAAVKRRIEYTADQLNTLLNAKD